jgi:hypothetical protein
MYNEWLTMNKKFDALFKDLRNLPFPALGKVIGDFALYDSLLAGTVSSFLQGAGFPAKGIPCPDEQTAQMLVLLKNKQKPNKQENEFLKYAELLEKLRNELVKAGRSAPTQASDPQTQSVR